MSSAKKNHPNYETLLKDFEQAQLQLSRTQLREKAAKKSLKDADKKDASKTEIEILRLELAIAKAKRKVRKAEANLAKIYIKQWIKSNAKSEKSYKLTLHEKDEKASQPTPEEVPTKRKYTKKSPVGTELTTSRDMEDDDNATEGKAGIYATEEDTTRSLIEESTEEKKERRPRRTSAEVEAEKEAARAALKENGDDFSIIEGIGPAVTKLLHSTGIQTFSQLASSNVDDVRSLLKSRRNNIADPTTWPQQAQLVVDNDWESLKQLQDSLKRPRS